MAIFKGFKPQGMQKIANKMGYRGAMENFDSYLEQNPDKQREMIAFENVAKKMAQGGIVRLQEGGVAKPTDNPDNFVPLPSPEGAAGGQAQPRQLSQSYVPEGGTYTG